MELYMKLSISPASRCLLPQKHLCNSVVSCKNELCILWIVFKQCWFYRLRWSRCSNYCFTWKNGGSNTGEHLTSLDVSLMQCSLSFFKHWQKHRRFFLTTSFQNKPSVNYAKDRLGQLLLICGLVWSGMEQGVTHGCDHNGAVNNHFPVYWAAIMADNEKKITDVGSAKRIIRLGDGNKKDPNWKLKNWE